MLVRRGADRCWQLMMAMVIAARGVRSCWPESKRRLTIGAGQTPSRRGVQKCVREGLTAGERRVARLAGIMPSVLASDTRRRRPQDRDPRPVPSDTDFTQPPGHIGQDLGIAPGQLEASLSSLWK